MASIPPPPLSAPSLQHQQPMSEGNSSEAAGTLPPPPLGPAATGAPAFSTSTSLPPRLPTASAPTAPQFTPLAQFPTPPTAPNSASFQPIPSAQGAAPVVSPQTHAQTGYANVGGVQVRRCSPDERAPSPSLLFFACYSRFPSFCLPVLCRCTMKCTVPTMAN